MIRKKDNNNVDLNEDETEYYELRLFVTGASPNSVRAISNIKRICELNIQHKYSLEIIYIYKNTALAEEEQLIALPVLIKKSP